MYHLGSFTLVPEIEEYPNSLFKAIFIKEKAKSLLSKPDVKAFVEKALRDYENRYNVEIPKDFPQHLFDFQKKDLAFALKLKRAAIFWEQGMGKTVLGVEWANRVPKPLLIVTRKRIIPNWFEHFKLFNVPTDLVFVTNYESLHKVKPVFKSVILDESHSVKNVSAKRTRQCFRLTKHAEYVLLLSGTPITRTPEDIYSQMAMLWPLMFRTLDDFRKEFVVMASAGFPVGFKNLDKLLNRVLAVSVVRKKEDFLSLPEKLEEQEFVELSEEQKQVAYELQSGFQWEDVEVANYLVLYQKLHQLSAGFLYREDGSYHKFSSPKTDRLIEIVKEVVENEQAIVWCLFRAEKEILEERLKAEDVSVTSDIDDFKSKKAQVLLANLASLSEGVNLQNCSFSIYHSLPWSYKDFAQSVDRTHRPGQKNTVRLKFLLNSDFIDGDILKALRRKHDYTPAEIEKRKAK